MADVPGSARCVVIGAGIVGNSLVHHLARLGWRDIVQLDQGPLPNPGGSTGHASNFIFLTDHSREITDLTLDSVEQYQELGVFTQCGGFEVARTEERMEELRRRMSSAKAWGIEAELVSPAFVAGEGAVPRPGPDHRRLLAAGRRRRRLAARRHPHARARARGGGADTVVPNVEVTDLDVEDGRIRRVHTDKGVIEAEYVVIACGVWSPKIGDMAGVSIPLTPAVHQMISVGPCPQLSEREGEISFPIVRDMDTFCYERQHGADMEVGLLRPPGDPDGARGHPVHRAVQAVAHRAAVHRGRLRHPARAGLRADARAARRRRRRDPLRHQRPAVADLRRRADPGREPREGPVDRERGLDQGRSGRRTRGRRVDDAGLVGDRPRPQRHRPLPRPPEAPRAHPPAHHRVVHQDLRHHPPRRAVRVRPRPAEVADVRSASRSWARSSSRPPAGSGRTGTSRTPTSSSSTATP